MVNGYGPQKYIVQDRKIKQGEDMRNNSEKEIFKSIEDALGLQVNSIGIDDTVDTAGGWDSLGFLAILSALEKKFGNKVADIDDLARVQSVKEIVDIFKREELI